jgi:hypothetical protein
MAAAGLDRAMTESRMTTLSFELFSRVGILLDARCLIGELRKVLLL